MISATLRIRIVFLPLLMLLLSAANTEAQMFGERQLGGTLRRRTSPGRGGGAGTNSIGTLRNQRFLRQNRGAESFVGRSRTSSFVGTQQATTAGTTTAVTPNLGQGSNATNQPYQRPGADKPYDPPLTVGFEHPQRPVQEVATNIAERLNQLSSPIEVSVEDRVATLRGVAVSEEERQIAAILVGFEPGISVVRNELQLAPQEATPPVPPPPR